MKTIFTAIIYLLCASVLASANDTADKVSQSRGECLRQLATLGKLIASHAPSERQVYQLRKGAGKVSVLCQQKRFASAHDLLEKMKASVMLTNKPTMMPPHDQKVGGIDKCLQELASHRNEMQDSSLSAQDRQTLKNIGLNMQNNCRLKQFGKALKDHKRLLHVLKQVQEKKVAQLANFKSIIGCRNKIRNLNKRLNKKKLSGRMRVWIRKSTKEIFGLCKQKKFAKAERQYQSVLGDYATFLNDEIDPELKRQAEHYNTKNCRQAYTYLFKAINQSGLTAKPLEMLRKKRKTLAAYCFERDYGNAKKLFTEIITALDNKR